MNPKLSGNQESEVLVLLSGGIDSAACVAFFQNRGNGVGGMFVDYGQISAAREKKAASETSGELNHFTRSIRERPRVALSRL